MEYALYSRNCFRFSINFWNKLRLSFVSSLLILITILTFSLSSYADDGLGDVVSSAVSGAGVGAAIGGATAGAAGVGVGAAIGACVAGCAQVTADIADAVHRCGTVNRSIEKK